ncbi:MAG: glycosyltransferase XagB [Patescibacteria group bacterium]|nr:glycosyltransferase XagB [Patescibacteria group bacterium]
MLEIALYIAIIAQALFLLGQSIFSIYQTIYIWDDPDRAEAAAAPKKFVDPALGFTVLLPARHEQKVIGDTLVKLSQAKYPKSKVELLVICSTDDKATIAAAQQAKKKHQISNARVVVFSGKPGKSRAMNIGLSSARHPIITIFDSEDDVSPEIFSIVNTLYAKNKVDIIQCGVQLMDYRSRWFSAHNVLEYFFWFKSRMHYYADLNSVPLGGNTVFFKREDLLRVGGWDEAGLTEDADIGIRLSAEGKNFGAMYDRRYVTKEECPHTVKAFIKQRTRWNQGFLQIIKKKDWKRLTTRKQLILVLYVLTAPTYMAVVMLFALPLVYIGASNKLPVLMSLLTFIPLFLMAVMMLISLIGLHEFGKDQNIRIKLRSYIFLLLTFIPYQVLLTISSVRAIIREIRGNNAWEKTDHLGSHRLLENHNARETV